MRIVGESSASRRAPRYIPPLLFQESEPLALGRGNEPYSSTVFSGDSLSDVSLERKRERGRVGRLSGGDRQSVRVTRKTPGALDRSRLRDVDDGSAGEG